MVGPTDDGKFLQLKVCSIQRNRSACRVLRAGQAATLALGHFDRSLLRKVSPPPISGSSGFKCNFPFIFLGTMCNERRMLQKATDSLAPLKLVVKKKC